MGGQPGPPRDHPGLPVPRRRLRGGVPRRSRLGDRRLRTTLNTRGALLGLILGQFIAQVLGRVLPQRWLSPRITLRVVRRVHAPGSAVVAADLRSRLPEGGRRVSHDRVHTPGAGRDGTYDLVLPDGPGPHPLVIWFPGGGWAFGEKEHVLPYLELLGTLGFAGAAVNTPRAPESDHAALLAGARNAVTHLLAHAAELGLDPDRVVLAGDSAGGQLAAELALAPDLVPGLRGLLLFCPVTDPRTVHDSGRIFAAFLESALWSLAGTRHWQQSPAIAAMSITDRITASFPETFLAAAWPDPLTRSQSAPFVARLAELGVPHQATLWGPETGANHEFQFRLGTPEAAASLDAAVDFLRRVTSNSH